MLQSEIKLCLNPQALEVYNQIIKSSLDELVEYLKDNVSTLEKFAYADALLADFRDSIWICHKKALQRLSERVERLTDFYQE